MTADHPQALTTHPNIKVVDGVGQYHSGTGKVLKPGDPFKVTGQGTFRCTLIHVERDGRTGEEHVVVDGYGGKKGRLGTRTFRVERCERIVKVKDDPNQGMREAVKETSDASKRGKRGYK
jgi:hypothetical protein